MHYYSRVNIAHSLRYLLVLVIVEAVTFVLSASGFFEQLSLVLLCNIGTIIFLINYFISCKISGSMFSNIQVFFIVFFLFQFGLFFLYGLGADYNYFYLTGHDIIDIKDSLVFCYNSLNLFNLGSMMGEMEYEHRVDHTAVLKHFLEHERLIREIAWVTFIVCSMFSIPFAFSQFMKALHGGYVLALASNPPRIVKLTESIYIPCCILCMIYSESHLRKLVIKVASILWGALYAFSGFRTMGISCVVTMLLLDNNERVGLSSRRSISRVVVIGLVALYAISVVSVYRNTSNRTLPFSVIAGRALTDNFLVGAAGEMGYSSTSLIMTRELVPSSRSFLKGMSYISGIICMIPEGLDPTGYIRNLLNRYCLLDSWLTNSTGSSFGTGYSLVAEAYINFGQYGFWVFLFLGFLLGKLFAFDRTQDKEIDIGHYHLKKYISFSMLYSLFTLPRRTSYSMFKAIFYQVLIPIGAMMLLDAVFYNKQEQDVEPEHHLHE